ncbi:MAG TPA: arginase family protein [Polyangiaceae bacterium]|nr:arginase family protein [Polyangiaceae bacterium]
MRRSQPPPRPSLSGAQPRFAGIPSFLRLPVHDQGLPPVDVLLCGAPFDGGTSFRPGARFGPRAVREASALSRPYSQALGVDIFQELSAADGGDVGGSPHDVERALDAIAARTSAIAETGAICGFVGGDQTVTLGALRGLKRAKHKSVGLLHIDSHVNASPAADDGRDLHHGSVIRHAAQEGLIRPDATMHLGVRGPYSTADDLAFALGRGFEVVSTDDVRWDLHAVVSQVRRLAERGALYVSIDVSVLDPAYAPGTGFPVPGGLSTWELQQILRALVGAEIAGFDVVEIAPAYDPSGITGIVGVTIVQEIMAALADTRRSARPAKSSRQGGAGRRGKRVSP